MSDSKKNLQNDSVLSDAERAHEAVDIDKIKLKILIICKNKPTFDSAASYLIRRGWETVVIPSVKDAFGMLSAFKPDYVLVSVNAPTTKIQQLPTVIFHTFHSPVITFGEASDTKTLGLMQSTPSNYKMPGAVSGPSIHRRIKQILQEIYKSQMGVHGAAHDEQNARAKLDDAVIIHGRNSNEKTHTHETSLASTEAGDSASLKGRGTMIFTSEKKEKGPGIIIAKGAQPKGPSQKYKNPGESAPDSEEDPQTQSDQYYGSANTESVENSKIAMLAEEFSDEVDTPSASEPMANTEQEQSGGLRSEKVNTEILKKGVATLAAATSSVLKKIDGVLTNLQGQKTAAEVVAEALGESENSQKTIAPPASKIIFGQAHELIDIAKQAVLPVDTEMHTTGAGTADHVVAWTLKTPEGWLLLASTYTGPARDFHMFQVRYTNAIREHYAHKNIPIAIDEGSLFVFPTAQFKETAPDEIFTSEMANGSGQILLKLVKFAEVSPSLGSGVISDKIKIAATELVSDISVGVDVYLYLPKNEKLYMYLNKGAALSEKQKVKLIKAAAELYINKDDVDVFKEAFRKNKAIESTIFKIKNKSKAA